MEKKTISITEVEVINYREDNIAKFGVSITGIDISELDNKEKEEFNCSITNNFNKDIPYVDLCDFAISNNMNIEINEDELIINGTKKPKEDNIIKRELCITLHNYLDKQGVSLLENLYKSVNNDDECDHEVIVY